MPMGFTSALDGRSYMTISEELFRQVADALDAGDQDQRWHALDALWDQRPKHSGFDPYPDLTEAETWEAGPRIGRVWSSRARRRRYALTRQVRPRRYAGMSVGALATELAEAGAAR